MPTLSSSEYPAHSDREPATQSAADSAFDSIVDQFSVLFPFPLDDFQRDAIRVLLNGESVMVAAPTGSGKTIVAEFGIFEALRRTGRVFYTAPIKALSNQKYRDLSRIYGDDVGLLTGDISENRHARVLVMTTEILRNMLLQSPWELDDVDTVIFDEIHYLADPDRGTTWEESIILCPDHIQLICLSATVTNADEIAGWISRTHLPIRLVTHMERPVPLALYYFHDESLSMIVDHNGAKIQDFGRLGGEARRQRGRGGRNASREGRSLDEPQPREIVDALQAGGLLPAIYFLFSRNDCQLFAEQLAMMRPDLVTETQQAQIDDTLKAYSSSLRPEDRSLDQVQVMFRLARLGIGFHHAGLLPVLKQVVEVLFSRGLMQVVFATDTLALGVNMPARSVVIGRMSKWDGRRRRPLIPNEFQQMAGRAGRRGMDVFGHVIVPYSPWMPFREMLEIATGPLHPVQSAFSIRYNTVLNLWDPPGGERVRQMLQRSLAQYQSSQRVRLIEADILEIEAEVAGIHGERGEKLAVSDAAYEEYQSLDRQLNAVRSERRQLDQELTDLRMASTEGTPWTEPGRQVVRRVLKGAPPGTVVHLRNHGWAWFVARPVSLDGIGLFLLDSGSWLSPTEYRQVDYIPDEVVIPLPSDIEHMGWDCIDQLPESVDPEHLQSARDRLEAVELPDLIALATEYREKQRTRLESRRDDVETRVSANIQRARELETARSNHAFDDSRVRRKHGKHLRYRDALRAERENLASILDREIDAEDVRIRNVIRGIRDVLHRFGYLHQGYPSEKADMLASIFDNDGLILCELVDRGTIEQLTPEELAELFSWFSFDREFRYANHFTLPDSLVQARRALDELEHEVLSEERDHKLFISEGHNPSFYGAALAWASGSTMAQIGEQLELSEGDLVLTFNKTIDLMRQVREMLIDVNPEHVLVTRLGLAERRLRRGIVEQSLTLGFSTVSGDNDAQALDVMDEDETTIEPIDDDVESIAE